MPIWLIVESDKSNKIHYPASTLPTDFGCNQVEVQHNGTKLIRVQLSPSGGVYTGPANHIESDALAKLERNKQANDNIMK
jgi:hypothetical protein